MTNTDWVAAEACTLPTVEQPLRVREFDALFADTLRKVEHLGPTLLRLVLEGSPELGERVRDLTDRETSCCSFFTFTIQTLQTPPDAATELIQLDIEVPAARSAVLEAMARRAQDLGVTLGSSQ